MTITEKAAYIKGLAEGLGLDDTTKEGKVFGLEPPTFVELEVTETEPGFKGDTATNATKPATLETGAVIQVPLFVNDTDIIRIDTRTGEYMERV